MKKKVYVLMVAKYFPAGHPRAGQETGFRESIELAISGKRRVTFTTYRRIGKGAGNMTMDEDGGKLHTIRTNYDLWARRAEKINRGEAVLSLRQWSGKPYRSRQEEFLRLEKIGVQKVYTGWMPGLQGIKFVKYIAFHVYDTGITSRQTLAQNDGLSFDDFVNWFPVPFGDGVIIHFSDFKY
jgi:hypothetical protein